MPRLAVVITAEQAAILLQVAQHKIGCGFGALKVAAVIECERRLSVRGDHQGVPGSEDLFIPQGRWPPAPRLVEFFFGCLKRGFEFLRRHAQLLCGVCQACRNVKDVAAFEITVRCNAVVGADHGGAFRPESHLQFGRCPGEEPAFLALAFRIEAVGVRSGVEGAFRRSHVALDVSQDLARDVSELLVSRRLVTLDVGARKQSVVIEHLLEVRHQPSNVGGVAVKASAHVIPDASPSYSFECSGRHLQRLLVPRCGGGSATGA